MALYSNTYYNQVVDNDVIEERVSRGNVKDIPTSYVIQTYEKENILPAYENNSSRNPLSTFQNEFGNFKVALNEDNGKIEGEIGSPKDIKYVNKENEDILGYKGAIWKASNLPYNDIDKVPIITPTHTSLYHKPSLASDTSYKREIGIIQRLQHPTLYREQFESKIIASSTYKPNIYSPRAGSLHTESSLISQPPQSNYNDIESRISHHKQDYSRSLDTYSHHPASFRDDSVDFGAATGNLGAFGWYSDHAVGLGEDSVIGLG